MHQSLWAPWRLAYLRSLDDAVGATTAGAPRPAGDGDFIRAAWDHPDLDRENHVVFRDRDGLILLNRYPYANGHLLVALGEARPRLLDYDPPQRASLWSLVERAVGLCRRTLAPQGINVGINEGSAAGAGVPAHLHAHVVPRWNGDTNFMSVVGAVRVIPDSLERMAEEYRRAAAPA
ncbi:MAG TPA: HIT domain-containing protein [Phycisphaerales bacterium]|nr:HIT domain-containing protein [Phycisphaerales bacterium]HMP36269.1 HIT domain-containing protein [Phycisphaerales bacterium]